MKHGVDFTHVVMTRFNMPTPGRESQIRSRPGWLEGRFDLFERFCLPSIAAQTIQDFRWIIYFDIDTPPAFRERIEACRQTFDFIPYFTGFFPGEGWPRSLAEVLVERTPWLLTSRLDSDDALAEDYAVRMQTAVAGAGPPVRCSFNLTQGMVIDRGRVYVHRHSSNAFAGWFEPWDDSARTIMSIQHMRLGDLAPIVQVEGGPAWLQVIHGGNVSNKVRGRRVPAESVHNLFPSNVVGELKRTSRAEIILENLVATPLRSGRDALVNRLRGDRHVSR